MIRFPGRLLVGCCSVVCPLSVGEQVVKRPVPEMAGPGCMAEISELIRVKNIGWNRTSISGINGVEDMFFRLVVAALLVQWVAVWRME